MAAKPIKSLELHYTMIQFLIISDIPVAWLGLFCNYIRPWWSFSQIFYLKHLSRLLKITCNILSPAIILAGTRLPFPWNNFLINFVQIPGLQVHNTRILHLSSVCVLVVFGLPVNSVGLTVLWFFIFLFKTIPEKWFAVSQSLVLNK